MRHRVSAYTAFPPGLCVLSTFSCLRGCGVVGVVDPIGLRLTSTTVSADILAERAWNATLQAHLHSQPCGQHRRVRPFGELLLQVGLGSVLEPGTQAGLCAVKFQLRVYCWVTRTMSSPLALRFLVSRRVMVDAPLQSQEDEMRPYYRAGLSARALKSSACVGFRVGRGAGFLTHPSGRSCSQLPLPPTSLPRIFPLRL